MKRLQTILPFETYKDLASSAHGFPGDQDFIDLLVPALREAENEIITFFIELQIGAAFARIFNNQNWNAIEVAIIREYVFRVLSSEREEWEARGRLAELKEKLQKDPFYTGIRPIPEGIDIDDPTQIAQEDLYSTYTVQQFQYEIDFLCKRSLEAQLQGYRDEAAALSARAADLTSRMKALQYQISLLNQKPANWYF